MAVPPKTRAKRVKPSKKSATKKKAKTSSPAKTKKAAASSKKSKVCSESSCKEPVAVKSFCRLHYIKSWKKVKDSERAKAEKRLNAYVDRLVKKYPKDYLEKLKEGIENEEAFQESLESVDLNDSENSEHENEFLEKFARDMKITGE